jgi:fructosamine-3-kinase
MSMGDVDISWQALRQIVQEWAGSSAELTEFIPLQGGQISTTLGLRLTDGSRAVLKISPHRVDKSYEREAYQLTLLKSCGLPVPEVYRWRIGDLDQPFSYLLMEFIDGIDLGRAKKSASSDEFDYLQAELGELVGSMHDHTNSRYMRVMEAGDTYENWAAFYRSVYDPIWQEAQVDPHLPRHCRKPISRLHDRLEKLLAHPDQPRLVHWDLWNTNILVDRNGDGRWHIKALLDPNCKFAHAEAEIAYMELFHTITPAFTRAYQSRHKLPQEYHRFRKPIYQLYPMINHLALFGEPYAKPLAAAVEKCAHLV